LDRNITEIIIRLVKEERPESIKQLVNRIKDKFGIPEHEIIKYVLQLQSEGRIKLKKSKPTPHNLAAYVKTEEAGWYWITVTLAAATTLVVFTVPENVYPLVYLRYVLGTIFVLWLPGYSFTKALFPAKPTDKSAGSLDSVERTALSIGLSLALVPIVGLLLNYTPWGIRLTPIVLSLFALTIIFATAAIIREHQTKTKASA
jgi:hypothetical protein